MLWLTLMYFMSLKFILNITIDLKTAKTSPGSILIYKNECILEQSLQLVFSVKFHDQVIYTLFN